MQMLQPEGSGAPRPVDVPILVGALGPKGREVAHEVGDGLYVGRFSGNVDSVSGDFSGVAKGSLYKHFSSKEKLAGAVMCRLLHQTLETLEAMPEDWSAARKLEAVLRWSLQLRLRNGVPHLPSTRGPLQRALLLNFDYLASALKVNKRFYALVTEAKAAGDINVAMPDDVIVYSLYSRACDPTVDFLRRDGKLKDEQIVESMVSATFAGFSSRSRE